MSGFLSGVVTFATNSDRNRAANAITSWVANWNTAHPGAQMTGSVTNTTYVYPTDDELHPGVSARALQVSYTCTDYSGIEDAQRAIAQDINANSFWDIVNLSTGQNP